MIKNVIIIINSETLWITWCIFFKWALSLAQADLIQWFIRGLISPLVSQAQHILLSTTGWLLETIDLNLDRSFSKSFIQSRYMN